MKRTRYLVVGTIMLLAAFCFLPKAYASDPVFMLPEGTFADSTGAFTFQVTVRNDGQTGSIDGYVKKAHNVLPQPVISPDTLTLTTGESNTFTVRGTLKDPTIAGSVALKFKYVDDDTGKKVTNLPADVLITPGS
jgi:autotransporter translocation and assembly factor TamB